MESPIPKEVQLGAEGAHFDRCRVQNLLYETIAVRNAAAPVLQFFGCESAFLPLADGETAFGPGEGEGVRAG